jgi:hypothetical protein
MIVWYKIVQNIKWFEEKKNKRHIKKSDDTKFLY